MLEKMVSLYYTDEWEEFASRGCNQLISQCRKTVQSSIQSELWNLLSNEWFHDTYITRMTCTQSNGVYMLHISIEKIATESRKIVLAFSDVSLLQPYGNILDKNASFPHPRKKAPIAQILDVWVEKSDELSCCILFENNRGLYVRCNMITII